MVSPFDAAYITSEQQDVIDSALDVLQGACMTAAGFVYQPEYSQPDSTSPVDLSLWSGDWGPLDPVSAAQHGYQAPWWSEDKLQNIEVTPETDADRAYINALDGSASDGPFGGGCSLKAEQQLGMADSAWLAAWNAVDDIRQQADADALNDSQVTGAVRSWSTCMAQQGFTYQTPQAAMSAWQQTATIQSTPSQAELTTAVADAQCKVTVNLMSTISQATIEYEQNAVTNNLPTVQHLQQLGMAAVAKAEAVMTGQPK